MSFANHLSHKVKNIHHALEASEFEGVVIASGSVLYRFRDDVNYPFSVNAYFRECLPQLNQPDCFLVFRRDSDRPTLLLKVFRDFWHSPPEPLPDEVAQSVEVVEYESEQELRRLLPKDRGLAFIGARESCPWTAEASNINPEGILNVIDYQRACKTPFELDLMRDANRNAIRGHKAAEQAFRQGLSEYEIHMTYLSAVGCREEELPYGNIVALNQHASVLHHMVLDTQRPKMSRSFLIDAGAQCLGYAADISRTYMSNSTGDGYDGFRALIDGVESLQQRLVESMRPGVDFRELNAEAHRLLASLLVSQDLLTVSAEEAYDLGVTRAFLPHGLGHLIGVQVHDQGGHLASPNGQLRKPHPEFPSLRCTRTAEENMVFTVEPGLYFIPMLLQPWLDKGNILNARLLDQLMPFGGIRIEDNVVVTENGVENLTREVF
ncbi:Xaa-Pro dipeptidase [Pseudomaricurvus alkylphenolicus]|jgi:Xaa-Pro dipeptidase|uniref:Xaa-Pro dipeptidase n=1 Tax=Pseudomaricurvus alkylphenolicus TaxID=1306991 RepID=UPI00141DABA7|nr:Xaa-Pro dipeptidase [Pseudomaricurvus alkylphenolicus]NIB40485.1 Xaa-Pro dipeptidase [Pseudomaricurvus alkylphenolicus]